MDPLPTGTVTFLYTDIEGSTRRWEAYPAEMKMAVERHDEILRRTIEEYGGRVFRRMGDAFCAAFTLAPDALASAVEAQRALNTEDWSIVTGPIRARMSLHTGTGEVRDDDYVGTALNRVARLLSAGHGGQTLLSQPAYDLVRDHLPEGVTIRERGEHRLKDLQRPERIYEAIIAGLPSDFPPLLTLDNRPNNLVPQRSALIGREKELAALQDEIRKSSGLVTLTGPGGVGKTRLAMQVAAELIDEFEHGVFLVNLASISDPSLLPSTIAQALDVKSLANVPILDTLKEHLREREMLLVLDNFEQVIAGAPLVASLIAGAPRLKVLATSREGLHLYNEQEFPVPPLLLPDPNKLPSLERLAQYEAVRLFIERAMSVKPDFTVTNENAPAVAEICARLDGLPLAIELAAARINILPPSAMLARLQSRLKLLTGGARDLPVRHQTLRSTLMWSYDLLEGGEQVLFRRLAVFVGGCTFEGAEAVCNARGDLEIDVLDGISSLVKKSLLRQVEGSQGEPRFVMLETVREYAGERLEESGEGPALRRDHGMYILSKIEQMGSRVLDGPGWRDTIEFMEDMVANYGNIRAAFAWSQLEVHEPLIALRMVAPMMWFYNFTGGNKAEGRKWLEGALQLASAPELKLEPARASALHGVAFLAFLQGEYPATRRWVEESVAIAREAGHELYLAYSLQLLAMVKGFQGEADRAVAEESVALFRKLDNKWGLAFALFTLGDISLASGDFDSAQKEHEESAKYYRLSNDFWGTALPLTSLGRIAWHRGEYERARTLVQEGIDYREQVGHRWLLTLSKMSLAEIARCQGRYDESVGLANESLAIFSEAGDYSGQAWCFYNLGLVAYYMGDKAEAASKLREALRLRTEQGNKEGIALCTAALGQLCAASGHHERAARLFGAAEAMFEAKLARLSPADRTIYDRDITSTRDTLGPERYSSLAQEGASLSPDAIEAMA
jgi:predicted ATPase/class 3 adenylate cyclase